MPADSLAHRIVVVDEYRGWRVAVANALVATGYEVWTAGRGDEALRTVATLCESERPVDLLLTEVEIGDMTGRELVRGACALCPRLQVLFMAYDDDGRIGEDQLLLKPFTLATLEQAVRRAMQPQGRALRCA